MDVPDDIISNVIHPPGRGKHKREREIGEWIAKLDDTAKGHLKQLMLSAGHAVAFSILVMFDGVCRFSDEDGELIIKFKTNKNEYLINNSDDELHSILNEVESENDIWW